MLEFFKSKSLSIVKDPFNKDSLERVWIDISKDLFNKQIVRHTATVEFKNADTEGKQKFKADNLQDLLEQIDNFIKTLP